MAREAKSTDPVGAIPDALKKAWRIVFSKKHYRAGQRLQASGVLALTLSILFLLGFVASAGITAAADGSDNESPSPAPTARSTAKVGVAF